ncbi:TonB-dependent receptor [Olleya namhaensis]|uniref:CarboxypepD_reg-like domain-containing protein n=1 Tax=Olleya namhaensis TaxID=1144750 RepID=A0A1I3JAK7_9FLAO|nr:hypothetical protein [Olleya namhaensis]SFI57287.1 hypothetical protein SAMN05443431_101328 [Olleya namhaensis]
MKINLYNRLIIILFFFIVNNTYSQILKGTIKDKNNNPLSAKLLVKKASKPNIISEFHLVKKGDFSYALKKTYSEDLIFEILVIGYVTYSEKITIKDSNDVFERSIYMIKEETNNLDEVFIVGKKAPFKIKHDTVQYNINSYKDGTERKLQDILKKLPGIEVNETSGLIKYNGKLIETVTLEGDNLFGYNYTLGTKNINVDMVEEVEAIENYSNNSLLKGLDQDGKVALNLKLKKNKTDVSGNLELGLGDFKDSSKIANNSSLNLLGINKYYKSFGTISFNNVGLNNSPFNFSSQASNMEILQELDYFSEKIIPEVSILNVLGERRANINNQLFSSYNNIFNFDKKLKAKVNLYYIQDKIQTIQLSKSSFTFNNDVFNTFDNINTSKKPIQYRGDLELKYFNSKSSLFRYTISARDENIETASSITSNQNTSFNTNLNSKNTFVKQHIEYTKRLSKQKALQVDLHFSTNNLNQEYNINPSFLNTNSNTYDNQNSNQKKTVFELKSTFLGIIKNNKYSFSSGVLFANQPFNSNLINLSEDNSVLYNNRNNDLNYSKKTAYATGSYNWNVGKLKLTPNVSLRLINQKLNNHILNNQQTSNILVFEPSLTLFYKINSVSFLSSNLGLNKNTNPIQYLYTGNILINNRTLLSNIPDITLQKNQSYSLAYNLNDLFNQSQIMFGVNYTKQEGNFFSNTIITSNSNTVNFFFLPEATESTNFNLSYSKFIPALNTNIKLNTFHSLFNYKNIVNNSQLRSNKTNHTKSQLFLKTAFSTQLNFENETTHDYSKTLSELTFTNSTFQNNFKIIYKPSKEIYGTLTANFFIPNLKKRSDNFTFIDTEIWYKPKNKDWQLSISASNLTNENSFLQIQNNDVSINTFSSDLLSRSLLLKFNHNF